MAGITQITPFIFTRDLDASCAFYASIGFTPTYKARDPGYAFCTGHGHALRLLEISPEAELGEQMIYLDVDDVDAFHATLRPVLDALPPGRVRAPFDQPYGQREFHVKDPDNCLLLFGARIEQPAKGPDTA